MKHGGAAIGRAPRVLLELVFTGRIYAAAARAWSGRRPAAAARLAWDTVNFDLPAVDADRLFVFIRAAATTSSRRPMRVASVTDIDFCPRCCPGYPESRHSPTIKWLGITRSLRPMFAVTVTMGKRCRSPAGRT